MDQLKWRNVSDCFLFNLQIQTQDPAVTGLVSWASPSLIPLSWETQVSWTSVMCTLSAKLNALAFTFLYTLLLLNNPPGEFSHLLPEEQIQPACEEAYAGALSIITHVHDKAFANAAVATVAGFTAVSGVAMVIWSVAVSLTTGVLVWDGENLNHTRLCRKSVDRRRHRTSQTSCLRTAWNRNIILHVYTL